MGGSYPCEALVTAQEWPLGLSSHVCSSQVWGLVSNRETEAGGDTVAMSAPWKALQL